MHCRTRSRPSTDATSSQRNYTPTDLDFANDLAKTFPTFPNVQNLLDSIVSAAWSCFMNLTSHKQNQVYTYC